MSGVWGKILIACVIGALASAVMGLISGMYGLPAWMGGALAGVTAPLAFFLLRGRARE